MGLINALAVFDDGTGPALFATGQIISVNGMPVGRIAKWDGEHWSALGSGLNGNGWSLATFDEDGEGPQPSRLFVSGSFTTAGGQPASRIARWDGQNWSAVGGGMSGTAKVLRVYDDGSGPALYAAGTFSGVNGLPTSGRVARWDGQRWSRVTGHGFNSEVRSLAAFDDGRSAGPSVYALGLFFLAGPHGSPGRIARWTGSEWADVGAGLDQEADCSVVDPDSGSLYVGGSFATAGGAPCPGLARWDGADWSPVGDALEGRRLALAMHDDGSGRTLYVGGEFTMTGGGASMPGVAKLVNGSWASIGGGVGSTARAMCAFDPDGDGPLAPRLVVGGDFVSAAGGSVSALRIAMWDGASWSAMGAGFDAPVRALAVLDEDGPGPQSGVLYAAGEFTMSGATSVSRVARWDGASWQPVALGVSGRVNSLHVFDSDGPGPEREALYAAGTFTGVNGVPDTARLAKWDGAAWSSVGNLDGEGLAVLGVNTGAHRGLWVGGAFTHAGGVLSARIARLELCDAPCPGDTNCDSIVNFADLNACLGAFGIATGATLAQGDIDGDGDVDFADLNVILSNFGVSC